jgi:hypothetical protein
MDLFVDYLLIINGYEEKAHIKNPELIEKVKYSQTHSFLSSTSHSHSSYSHPHRVVDASRANPACDQYYFGDNCEFYCSPQLGVLKTRVVGVSTETYCNCSNPNDEGYFGKTCELLCPSQRGDLVDENDNLPPLNTDTDQMKCKCLEKYKGDQCEYDCFHGGFC